LQPSEKDFPKMSSDNGIYVAFFPLHNSNEKEIRVAECAAIFNINCDNQEKQDAYRVLYFHPETGAFVTKEKNQALLYAMRTLDECCQAGLSIEYGIVYVYMDRPFPDMSLQQAKAILAPLVLIWISFKEEVRFMIRFVSCVVIVFCVFFTGLVFANYFWPSQAGTTLFHVIGHPITWGVVGALTLSLVAWKVIRG
jgi:hypothetical protein